MTDYKLTDAHKKLLNKLLGESIATSIYTVASTGELVSVVSSIRAYGTDSDMMAVRRALREKGWWARFYQLVRWNPLLYKSWDCNEVMAYLDEDPERHNWLVAKFLEEMR